MAGFRKKGPSSYRFSRGPENEVNKAQVATARAQENEARGKRRLAAQLAADRAADAAFKFRRPALRAMSLRKVQALGTTNGVIGAYRMRKDDVIDQLMTIPA